MTKKNSLSLFGLALLTSCNLAIDPEQYPYQQSIVAEDAAHEDMAVLDEGMPVPDMAEDAMPDLVQDMVQDLGQDTETDTGPIGTPELMITEVLINPSLFGVSGSGENGEFIEIKNIGTAPADPRRASFQVSSVDGSPQTISVPAPTSADQLAIYSALKPIQPGEYFVYVRFVSEHLPLTTMEPAVAHFDYGKSGVLVSLSNSGARTLTLQYFDGKTIRTQDSIRWGSSALRPINPEETSPSLTMIEDVSWSVGRDFETAEGNDTPANWCAEITEVTGTSPIFASPGGPAICVPSL